MQLNLLLLSTRVSMSSSTPIPVSGTGIAKGVLEIVTGSLTLDAADLAGHGIAAGVLDIVKASVDQD